MPDPNFVRVGGVPYSWNSCAHFIQGLPYKGILAVDWGDNRETKLVHAAQQDGIPLGQTAGQYKCDPCTLRCLRDTAHAIMTDLTVFGLGSFGDAEFTYVCQVFEPVAQITATGPALPITTTLSGCRITAVKEKQELGVDELVTEFTIQPLFITRLVAGVPLILHSAVRKLLP